MEGQLWDEGPVFFIMKGEGRSGVDYTERRNSIFKFRVTCSKTFSKPQMNITTRIGEKSFESCTWDI